MLEECEGHLGPKNEGLQRLDWEVWDLCLSPRPHLSS